MACTAGSGLIPITKVLPGSIKSMFSQTAIQYTNIMQMNKAQLDVAKKNQEFRRLFRVPDELTKGKIS